MRSRPHYCKSGSNRCALWCALIVLGLSILATNGLVEGGRADLRDPEYARRIDLLRTRLQESIGRPLLLALGTSRCGEGFRPEVLPTLADRIGRSPLVFNFSHAGAGPVLEQLLLRRLLRQGIRPTWLLLEVLPTNLVGDGDLRGRGWWSWATLQTDDLATMSHYVGVRRVLRSFVGDRAAPLFTYRFHVQNRLVERLAGRVPEDWANLGPLGGPRIEAVAPTAEQTAEAVRQHGDIYRKYAAGFELGEVPRRALCDTLTLCGDEGITVALLWMPEHSAWHAWYTPDALRRLDDFLAEVRRKFAVPLIDARFWMGDDLFCDSHHLTSAGADAFTARLAREGLEPLVMGSTPVKRARFAEPPRRWSAPE
jgi:hypothetical protein